MIQRPEPELYRRARLNAPVTARFGRLLLRSVGGLPDPPHELEAARVDLLQALMRRATSEAVTVREVATVLDLRGRRNEAAFVRRWGEVHNGRAKIAAECHYAAQMGPAGVARARALRWALKRLGGFR